MGNVVTMTSTVADLTSGQTYYVRSREAELLVAQSKATKLTVSGASINVLPAKTGKRGL
jgi:hypothetical protein